MKEDDVLRVRDYLEHIELAIARIRRYLAGLDRASFLASEEKQDAVIRNIEIIGEAAQSIRRRHPEFAARHPEIPWGGVYGMRNAIAQGFCGGAGCPGRGGQPYILGLNAYHGDSSACLVKDGALVAAAEEERFRRIKHWAGFPSEAIRYCLAEAGIRLADVDVVAINQDAGANLWKKVAYMVMRRPDLSLVLDRIRNKRERAGVAEELARAFPGESLRAEVREVEHHLAHLGSAFLVSPFEEAVAVSVDGFGDFASAAWGVGRGSRVEAEDKVYFPHSLGIFYQALTQYLGFPHYGDEYKVMGLAPYGEPRFMDEMRQIVKLEEDGAFRLNLDYFRHHREKIAYEWENGEPSFSSLYSPRLAELLGPARKPEDEELTQRHKDIARSVQAMYEEAFLSSAQSAARALRGGCAGARRAAAR